MYKIKQNYVLEKSNDTYGFWIIDKDTDKVFLRTYMLKEEEGFSAYRLNPINILNPVTLLRTGTDKNSVEEAVKQEIDRAFANLQSD